ncbi:MAG: sodium/solute symporter [Candidatus Omnitrophica bacterium]|nr:sodium/solute symporter [Candidatus Omnitrophota bacterium]
MLRIRKVLTLLFFFPFAALAQGEESPSAGTLGGLTQLDWVVLAGYGILMIGVGWYYSRKTRTTEEYLLGGRKMNPWTVGLSLFASLLSTISYLASPGEMIRYGPLFMSGMLSYPFIYAVVGWGLIPLLMRTRVTSAYEILEERLGIGTRIMGALFFLSMRVLWMSVIIYATASKVLIPMLGWKPESIPYLCLLLGTITVIYTSMGGLRAVVLTDVLQTFILFLGAVITLGLISSKLGGVAAWWPHEWPSHWPEPELGYNPSARMSLVGMMLAHFTWYVCTAASDQMAVQRYQATKDLHAARKSFATSLCAEASVSFFLGLVGLALLAFYQHHPDHLPQGKNLIDVGDRLFTRFIVWELPAGISGLVIAGLLAAAMSSLSSGLNSSCSVITVDFLDRFSPVGSDERAHLRRAIVVSVILGVSIVTLSTFIGGLEGNLLEIAYKTSNLLVAPLAGLFFLAFFVPWANSVGAIAGAICSVVVVVCINYWKDLTGTTGISFLWAMPLGLATEMVVGMLVSYIVPTKNGSE